MSLDHSIHGSDELSEVWGEELFCTRCVSDEYLQMESIQASPSQLPGFVFVAYICNRCHSFYSHESPVACVGKVLNQQPRKGVVQFGRHHLHCGAPMTNFRCHCGFQMPDPTL